MNETSRLFVTVKNMEGPTKRSRNDFGPSEEPDPDNFELARLHIAIGGNMAAARYLRAAAEEWSQYYKELRNDRRQMSLRGDYIEEHEDMDKPPALKALFELSTLLSFSSYGASQDTVIETIEQNESELIRWAESFERNLNHLKAFRSRPVRSRDLFNVANALPTDELDPAQVEFHEIQANADRRLQLQREYGWAGMGDGEDDTEDEWD
jgi:hypothetical protein